jgi:hypothetical protein
MRKEKSHVTTKKREINTASPINKSRTKDGSNNPNKKYFRQEMQVYKIYTLVRKHF